MNIAVTDSKMITHSTLVSRSSDSLPAQQSCPDCIVKSREFFCSLVYGDLLELRSITITKAYPKRTTLFAEGQPVNGVFILCRGRVKLSTCSRDGKVIIIGVAGPGEVIGLSALMSGVDHEVTAEVIEFSRINYIPGETFLKYLATHPKACLTAARQLGRNYHEAHQKLCAFGMSQPVLVKLAKLILGWSPAIPPVTLPLKLRNSFTHEEMAEMIGTSRETVTRTLREMRERGLVTIKGSELVIHDWYRLSSVAGRPFAMRAS